MIETVAVFVAGMGTGILLLAMSMATFLNKPRVKKRPGHVTLVSLEDWKKKHERK